MPDYQGPDSVAAKVRATTTPYWLTYQWQVQGYDFKYYVRPEGFRAGDAKESPTERMRRLASALYHQECLRA